MDDRMVAESGPESSLQKTSVLARISASVLVRLSCLFLGAVSRAVSERPGCGTRRTRAALADWINWRY
jgi:hypothetical protein